MQARHAYEHACERVTVMVCGQTFRDQGRLGIKGTSISSSSILRRALLIDQQADQPHLDIVSDKQYPLQHGAWSDLNLHLLPSRTAMAGMRPPAMSCQTTSQVKYNTPRCTFEFLGAP